MRAGAALKPAVAAVLAAALLLSASAALAAKPGTPGRRLFRYGIVSADGGAGTDALPAPAKEPAASSPDACEAAVQNMVDGCPISLDRIALTYSRGSEAPPTQGELEAAVADLASAGLPPAK